MPATNNLSPGGGGCVLDHVASNVSPSVKNLKNE